MIINDIAKFLNEIDVKNKAASRGSFKIKGISDEDYAKTLDFLLKNQYAIQNVLSKKDNELLYREELIQFLHREFIYLPTNLTGWYGKRKKLLLLSNSYLLKGSYLKIFNSEVEPLIDAFDQYESTINKLDNRLRETTLIITALPLEFRAVVRRFSFLIDVKKIKHTSDRVMDLRHELVDPIQFVFDIEKDNFIHPDAKDNDPHDRPFYVFVVGVLTDGTLFKKVHIVLLPNYGHYNAYEAMHICESYNGVGINYTEIIVTGIAGSIDEDDSLRIGDLVISGTIYGSETKKATEKHDEYIFDEPSMDIEFRSINEHNKSQETIDFVLSEWKPKLLEVVPLDIENPHERGFNKALMVNYVSIDTLSKASWFKKKLWQSFPSCKAIEMESFGVARYLTKKDLHKEVRVIKSICDYGDYRKNKIWQPYCADVAASFVEDYLITKYGKPIVEVTY